MTPLRFVAVSCRLSPGMFSSERIFSVRLADGTTHTGIAPRHFCWNEKGVLLGEQEPAHEASGFVAGRVVEQIDESQVAVEVPDAEVIAVAKDAVRPRPTEIKPPNAYLLRGA